MPKPLVLDTQLLVLLIAGSADIDLIKRHKRLSAYDSDGFYLLVDKIEEYTEVILTPNTLTEASNHLRQIGGPDRARVTYALGAFMEQRNERYVVSSEASRHDTFLRFGLTDAALIIAARSDAALLSADHRLYLAALERKIDALNFAHLYEAKFG